MRYFEAAFFVVVLQCLSGCADAVDGGGFPDTQTSTHPAPTADGGAAPGMPGGGTSSSSSGGGPGDDAGGASGDAGSAPCPPSGFHVAVVDYFTGAAVTATTTTVDGGTAAGGPSCLSLGDGVHPVSITAPGYATYNGAIQVPGGAQSRTVSLFPVTASLAGWLALVNADRQANGVPPVGLDNGLTIAAWDHAVDMGLKGYYAHFDPHGFAPTTRSLLLGSMIMGSENLDVGEATYSDAEAAFVAEKQQLPNHAQSDCVNDDKLAGHYCNLVWTQHNWVGLAIASVPGSPWVMYYDQEFGDLYGYYDTTVLAPEPALGTSAQLTLALLSQIDEVKCYATA